MTAPPLNFANDGEIEADSVVFWMGPIAAIAEEMSSSERRTLVHALSFDPDSRVERIRAWVGGRSASALVNALRRELERVPMELFVGEGEVTRVQGLRSPRSLRDFDDADSYLLNGLGQYLLLYPGAGNAFSAIGNVVYASRTRWVDELRRKLSSERGARLAAEFLEASQRAEPSEWIVLRCDAMRERLAMEVGRAIGVKF